MINFGDYRKLSQSNVLCSMASLLLLSDSDSWHGRQNITVCFKLGHKPNMSENMIHDVTLLGHKYEMDMIVD